MMNSFLCYFRADMWAILGVWAVQKTIENNNNKCSSCEEVPDLQVTYTHGRNVTHTISLGKSVKINSQDCSTAPYTTNAGNFP